MCNQTLDLLNIHQPNAVVCLGDVLDRHETIHVGPLLRSIQFFESIAQNYKLYILIGNHDRPSNQVFMTDEHPFTALKLWKNTTIVDKTCIDQIEGISFAFVPYVPPGRFMEALEGVDIGAMRAIFAHQEFYGAKMGATESLVGDKWDESFPLVISGHIHDYDQLQNNIIYTGTPIQHAYGDREDKGVFMFRFGYTVESEMLDLKIPKKKIVRVKASNIASLKSLDSSSHYKIVITGTPEEIKSLKLGPYVSKLAKYKLAYKTVSTITDMHPCPEDMDSKDFLETLYEEIKDAKVEWNDKIDMINNFHELFGSIHYSS
jgi:DNA repair exonuclease SbcCD nuclease subunit